METDLATCAVCLDRPADVVMVPCGHIFACDSDLASEHPFRFLIYFEILVKTYVLYIVPTTLKAPYVVPCFVNLT